MITSLSTVLLAFPSVVERVLNSVVDKVSVISFDREFRRKVIEDMITSFDAKHNSFSSVVEIQPDLGISAIWLNPDATHFWQKKKYAIGAIEYGKLSIFNDLRTRQCIHSFTEDEIVFACNLLGRTHLLVTFPQSDVDVSEFEVNLALLAGRIDRLFVHR